MAVAHARFGGFSSPRRRLVPSTLRVPPATGLRSSRLRWPRTSPNQILDRLAVWIHQLGVPSFEGPALVARRVHPSPCPYAAGKAAVDARRPADVAQYGADPLVERRVVLVVDLQPAQPFLDLSRSPVPHALVGRQLDVRAPTGATRSCSIRSPKGDGHAQPAFFILGRIAGYSDEAVYDLWNRGGRETIIEAARSSSR